MQTTIEKINIIGCGCSACQKGQLDLVNFSQAENSLNAPQIGLPLYPSGPTAQVNDFANYLTNGFWSDVGQPLRSWAQDNITFKISNEFSASQQDGIRMAFNLWADVADITFSEVGSGENITINEGGDSSAYSSSSVSSGNIIGSVISIDTNVYGWSNLNTLGDYALLTAIHEIGHSLGLGHTGNYNGTASYAADAQWANDTHQMSVMSYFDATNVGSDHWNSTGAWQYSASPMLVDILAIQNIYGANYSTRNGDTVYGFNSTANRAQFDFSVSEVPIAIWDGGGNDTIDLSGYSTDSILYLTEGDFSSAGTMTNNIVIAFGAVIENGTGGTGNDTIYGNTANNLILGGAGADNLNGSLGDDTLNGQQGNDTAVYNYSITDFAFNFIDNLTVTLTNLIDSFIDTLISIENFVFGSDTYTRQELETAANNSGPTGSNGDDILTGDNNNDTINAGSGNDVIDGGGGNDIVQGGAGDDRFLHGASASADTDDVYDGGTGTDTLDFSGFDKAIWANLEYAGTKEVWHRSGTNLSSGAWASIIDAENFEDIIGSDYDDFLRGDSGDNVLEGGDGDDSLLGRSGNDSAVYNGIFSNYSVNVNASGNGTITDNVGAEGTDTLNTIETILFADGVYDTASGAFTAINNGSPPVAQNDRFNGTEDQTVVGNVLSDHGSGADSDPDGDPLNVVAGTYTSVHGGMVTIGSNGDFTYTPATNFNGVDSFTYTLNDGNGNSDTATVTLTIAAVNDAPMAQDDSFNVTQDTQLTGANVLSDNGNGADSDPDGDALSITPGTFATTQGGSVTISGNGNFTYTPDTGFTGTDSFTYTLNDDQGESDSATVTVNVAAPSSTNVVIGTAAGETLNGTNDTDELYGLGGNDTLNAGGGDDILEGGAGNDIVRGGADDDSFLHGASASADTGDVYNGETGTDTLDFSGFDKAVWANLEYAGTKEVWHRSGTNLSSGAWTSIIDAEDFENITGSDFDDYLRGDSGDNVLEGGDGDDSLLGRDGNDRAVYSGTFSNYTVNANTSGNGTVTDNVGAEGTDTLNTIETIQFADGTYDTASGSFTPSNTGDPPIAQDDSFNGTEDMPVTGNILTDNGNGSDNDPNGDTLNVISGTYTTIQNGSVTIDSNGDFTYTPATNFNGVDSFTYTLNDGNGNSDTATVMLTITAVNEAPIAQDDSFNVTQDTPLTGVNVLSDNGNGADSDPDGDTLSVTAQNITTAQNGTVILLANGDFTYTPNAGYTGNDTFTYTLNDGNGENDTGTVTLIIGSPVNVINGTTVGETLNGTNDVDEIYGLGGNDTINAGGGNDIIDGGTGNDTLNGEGGDDTFLYSSGFDAYNGGSGADTADFSNLNYAVWVNFEASKGIEAWHRNGVTLNSGTWAQVANFTDVENVIGTDYQDLLLGDSNTNVMQGGDNNDEIKGRAGDDILYGGAGDDVLWGDAGADTFIFESASAFSSIDSIEDFSTAQGDTINISDLLFGYDPLTDAIEDFVQITNNGSNSILSVDANGGADDFVQIATIQGVTGLTDEDFLETSGALITA